MRMLLLTMMCLIFTACNAQMPAPNGENHHLPKQEKSMNLSNTQAVGKMLEKRYFRNCSCLHKRKDHKPTYLYDEITYQQAQDNADNQAYWVGYFDNQTLIRYEKVYRGEVMIAQDVNNDKPF